MTVFQTLSGLRWFSRRKREKKKTAVASHPRGAVRGFGLCSASVLFQLHLSDVRRKKSSLLACWPIWYSLGGAESYHPHPTPPHPHPHPNPPTHALKSSLLQSQVTCYSILCLAWMPNAQMQGQDFPGVAFGTAPPPQLPTKKT